MLLSLLDIFLGERDFSLGSVFPLLKKIHQHFQFDHGYCTQSATRKLLTMGTVQAMITISSVFSGLRCWKFLNPVRCRHNKFTSGSTNDLSRIYLYMLDSFKINCILLTKKEKQTNKQTKKGRKESWISIFCQLTSSIYELINDTTFSCFPPPTFAILY